jgi:hypothetical protein
MPDYPTLTKTWQYTNNTGASTVNQILPATGVAYTDNRQLMAAFIYSLISFTSSPWTIVSSQNWSSSTVASGSNNVNVGSFTGSGVLNVPTTLGAPSSGTVFVPALNAVITYTGISGGNQYTGCTTTNGSGVLTTGQVVYTAPIFNTTGNAHTWWVLNQPGVSATFQILIDLSGSSNWEIVFSWSPSVGFSGGSSTTAPSLPADGTAILNPGFWGQNTSDQQYRLHVMQSTDGACTRALFCGYDAGTGGVCAGFFDVELAQNPVTGWAYPVHIMWQGANYSNVLTQSNFYNTYNGHSWVSVAMPLAWTGENYDGNLIAANMVAPDAISQEFIVQPIGMWSNTTGNKGRHGQFFDLWWGPWNGTFTALGFGTSYAGPSASSNFVQVGCLIFPWNGTQIRLS